MSKELPARLANALGRGHAEADVWRLVRQFELYGEPVAVVRWQFGGPNDVTVTKTEIYRTKTEVSPDEQSKP